MAHLREAVAIFAEVGEEERCSPRSGSSSNGRSAFCLSPATCFFAALRSSRGTRGRDSPLQRRQSLAVRRKTKRKTPLGPYDGPGMTLWDFDRLPRRVFGASLRRRLQLARSSVRSVFDSSSENSILT